MAGEVEEPFRLNFQADSLHSGSISFGRFESEDLCWERRSSFSHNRYLEEVEKCSKPGLVIEKKAYFEAHFRKKGILSQTSPDSQKEYRTNENDISDKTDEESQSPSFDEIPDGLVQCGRKVIASDVSDRAKIIEVEEEDSATKLGDSLDSTSASETEENIDGESTDFYTIHLSEKDVGPLPYDHATDENGNTSLKHRLGSSLKEKVTKENECTNARLMARIGAVQSRRRVPSKEFKGSEKKPKEKVYNVVQRSKTETKASESAAPLKQQMIKAPNCEPGSKAKEVTEIKSAGKELRNGAAVHPRSSTLQKVSTRAHRVKTAIVATKPEMNAASSWFSYKSHEGGQRRKELVDKMKQEGSNMHQLRAKNQEKKDEIKLLQKSHNFKATPLPSFYYGVSRDSDRSKALVTSNGEAQKLQTNSSRPGNIRVANRVPLTKEERTKQASLTSNHQSHDNLLVSAKKENEEKRSSLHKQKVSAGNALYKGNTLDRVQLRAGRGTKLVALKK